MATKSADVATRIEQFNAGRLPDMLQRKYAALRCDSFRFLRGTCHLFFEDLPEDLPLFSAPLAWVCGDLHLENFGTYKGDDRLVYFDINDFDEACLAPATLDVLRLAVSILLGMKALKGVNGQEAVDLCRCMLKAYAAALADGKAKWLDRDLADGMIGELFDSLRQRSRKDYIADRTEGWNHHRRLKLDGKRCVAVADDERRRVEGFMAGFAADQDDPDFYRVIDVARRIAGIGSLGLQRYAVLVEGKGGPEGNYLLDLKEATSSALAPLSASRQPDWGSEAARVVVLQKRGQAIPMAFLHDVTLDGKSFLLRGLQPSADRVDLDGWDGKLRSLEALVSTMGRLTAWSHLRGSGRQGSAIADDLVAFGAEPSWIAELLSFACDYTGKVEADWMAFCASDLGR